MTHWLDPSCRGLVTKYNAALRPVLQLPRCSTVGGRGGEGESTCFAYASGTNRVKFHLILCAGHVQFCFRPAAARAPEHPPPSSPLRAAKEKGGREEEEEEDRTISISKFAPPSCKKEEKDFHFHLFPPEEEEEIGATAYRDIGTRALPTRIEFELIPFSILRNIRGSSAAPRFHAPTKCPPLTVLTSIDPASLISTPR